jgi:hypothetical protein
MAIYLTRVLSAFSYREESRGISQSCDQSGQEVAEIGARPGIESGIRTTVPFDVDHDLPIAEQPRAVDAIRALSVNRNDLLWRAREDAHSGKGTSKEEPFVFGMDLSRILWRKEHESPK